MNRFSLDDLLLGEGYDEQKGRLREEPAFTGYLVNQVIRGRSDLVEGRSRTYVSNPTMDAFEELVLREGGVSLEYRAQQHPEHPLTIMRLGRFIVRHKREVAGPSRALSDSLGPWGIPRTASHEDADRARQVFEMVRRGLSSLPSEGTVYDRSIEVEWDIPVRVPVRAPVA